MIDIPFEANLIAITIPVICRFADKTHNPPKYRYHFIIPLIPIPQKMYIKCDITSNLDIRYSYHNFYQTGADDCLIEILPQDYPFLSKPSIINCNSAKLYESTIRLKKDLYNEDEFRIIESNLPQELICDVIEKIKISPCVKRYIQDYLQQM